MSFLQIVPHMNIRTCKPLAGISDDEIACVSSAVDIELQKPISRKIYLWHKADFDHII